MATAIVPRSVFAAGLEMAVFGRRLGVVVLDDKADTLDVSRLGVSVVK